jgi:hypothetical protein
MPHVYESSREKRIDLWVGFGGWIALSAGMLLVVTWLRPTFADQLGSGMLIFVTAGAALLLLLTRPYAAFGWVLAASTVVALVVVEMPFFLLSLAIDVATGGPHTSYCGNARGICIGPPSTTVALIVGFAVYLIAAWFSLRGIDRHVR